MQTYFIGEDIRRSPEVRERLRASGAYSSRERINRNERLKAATIEVAERPQSPWNKIFGHKAFLRLSHKKKSAMRARGQSPCHLPLFHVKHRNCTKIPSPWEREWHNKMSNYSKKHIFARLELEIRKKHRYINDCAEWNTYINISITKFDRKKMKIAKKLHSGRHVIAKMNS